MSEPQSDALVDAFKESMARVSSSVAVITTMTDTGPHGTTVSAFMSLSVAPPMVVVALNDGSTLLDLIGSTRLLGVNVLSREQSGIARNFARRDDERFAVVPWRLDHGAPRLANASSWLACEVADLVPGGDHVLVLAAVRFAEAADSRPLTYHARSFGTHVPLAERSVAGAA